MEQRSSASVSPGALPCAIHALPMQTAGFLASSSLSIQPVFGAFFWCDLVILPSFPLLSSQSCRSCQSLPTPSKPVPSLLLGVHGAVADHARCGVEERKSFLESRLATPPRRTLRHWPAGVFLRVSHSSSAILASRPAPPLCLCAAAMDGLWGFPFLRRSFPGCAVAVVVRGGGAS